MTALSYGHPPTRMSDCFSRENQETAPPAATSYRFTIHPFTASGVLFYLGSHRRSVLSVGFTSRQGTKFALAPIW